MIVDAHIEELKALFIKHGVVLAYLFGSQAEGKTTPLSDIDLAVLFRSNIPASQRFRAQIDLIGDCGHVFHRNDVDVIVLNEAPPLLAYNVVKFGRALYEDPKTRPLVDFVTYTLSRHADTIPFRRLQHQYLFDRIRRHKARLASTEGTSA